ncbi:MAG: dihydroorotase [Gammaproteobacteria bacterium]
MITLQNVTLPDGSVVNKQIPSEQTIDIDAKGLMLLPAVIDPHVHFRTPGLEYKEDWRSGAKAAIRGGCTHVFDMPNTLPPTITQALLREKKQLIDSQLQVAGIPLRYELFFGADKQHLDEITKLNHQAIGIKVFMGCSTGNLVIDDDESLAAVFKLAAKENLIVAVHAEDEHIMHANKIRFKEPIDYATHSLIRNVEAAVTAVKKAIHLTRQYGTKLYILHISTKEEIELIKAAKCEGLPVFAETTPHHLFFDDSQYVSLGGKAVVNPPLRSKEQRKALFEAILDQVIDTIGSDHAPHTLAEKEQPYGRCPSGMPGIEFVLPLLLNACHEKLLTLDKVISLTSLNARQIFNLTPNEDYVLVDLSRKQMIKDTVSKCGWTPYAGLTLSGWPVLTIIKGRCFWREETNIN